LTVVGTVLGIAALVATVGLASTAGAQILTRLDVLAATDVVVEPRAGRASVLGWDAADEVALLHGVRSAALISPVVDDEGSGPDVATVLASDDRTDVIAVSAGVWEVTDATLGRGRFLGPVDESATLPTAVLGATAAARLGIFDVSAAPTVFVDGHPVTGRRDPRGNSSAPGALGSGDGDHCVRPGRTRPAGPESSADRDRPRRE